MHTFGSRDVSLRHSIFIHTHARLAHTYCVWPHPPPYTNVWPEGGVVVLHVKQCLQTCCFVVFILVPYHTHIQSFSFITCSQICPYYNVWPGAVYCCFNKNYNVYKFINMTLHAGLANPTCLQSFMIWYCLVSELRCLNSKKKKKKKKKKEKKMKNCGAYGRIGIFCLTLSHARIYMIFGPVVYFDELSHVTVSNLRLTSY